MDEEKEEKDLGTKPLKKEIPVGVLLSDPALLKIMESIGVVSVDKLAAMSDEELLKIPGIQQTRLKQIRRLLQDAK